jgi:hypothetical protein
MNADSILGKDIFLTDSLNSAKIMFFGQPSSEIPHPLYQRGREISEIPGRENQLCGAEFSQLYECLSVSLFSSGDDPCLSVFIRVT